MAALNATMPMPKAGSTAMRSRVCGRLMYQPRYCAGEAEEFVPNANVAVLRTTDVPDNEAVRWKSELRGAV